MNVRDVIKWVRLLKERATRYTPYNLQRPPVCAPECGPHWRGGFCDDDCPNAPDIARHVAEHFRDGPPVHITSLEQYRELFGAGSSGESWVRAHLDEAGRMPPGGAYYMPAMPPGVIEELESTAGPDSINNLNEDGSFREFQDRIIANIRSHYAVVADNWNAEERRAILGLSATSDRSVDEADPDEWEPPGEAEGLPPWVEDQIPEPCPECGLSQLGALTIRRTDANPVPGIELDSHGRAVAIHVPAPLRVVNFQVRFKCPGIRLVKAMQDHAGRWPLQRKER